MSVPFDKLMEAVFHRATLDRAFRARLLAEPAATVREAFGTELPGEGRASFVERYPGPAGADLPPFTFVLPPFAEDGADDELSDDDLDAAAGGSDDWFGETDPPGGG